MPYMQKQYVQKTGRFFAVGDQDEIMKLYKEQDEIIDLHGGTLLPGFIDGHSHFVGCGKMQ